MARTGTNINSHDHPQMSGDETLFSILSKNKKFDSKVFLFKSRVSVSIFLKWD